MRVDFQRPIRLGAGADAPVGWGPFVMLLVGVPWGIWSAYTLMGGGGSRSVEFNAAAGWFVVLAMGYLGLHGVRGIAWSGVPALLTVEGLFGFVLIPAWRFAHGQDVIDASYIRAMDLALIGFVAFWIGSLLCMKKATFQLFLDG